MGALKTNYNTGDTLPAADYNATNAAINGATSFGTYASMPAAGQQGRLYYCTDCDAVFQDSGTAWTRVRFGAGGTNQALPPTSGWSNNTYTGASVAASLDGYLMTQAAQGTSGDNYFIQYRTLSPTSNYTAKFYIDWNLVPNTNCAGVVFVGDGTKMVSAGFQQGQLIVFHMNAYNSFNSSAPISNSWAYGAAKWWAINDDGTKLNFQVSLNGVDWLTFYSESRTAFLTPSVIGWGLNGNFSGTYLPTGRLRSLTGVS